MKKPVDIRGLPNGKAIENGRNRTRDLYIHHIKRLITTKFVITGFKLAHSQSVIKIMVYRENSAWERDEPEQKFVHHKQNCAIILSYSSIFQQN